MNSVDTPFLFDDRTNILLNDSLIDPWQLRAVLLHNIARPVVNVSYAFDAAVWGISAFGFHLTNVLLHIIVVGLFYGVCTRALGDARRTGAEKSDPDPAAAPAAFFAAAVLAAHPVMAGTVNYVSARSELLCAAAFLTCLTFARRAMIKRSTTTAAMAGVAGIVAIGSSSSAAALPLVVLTYDAWVLRDGGWRGRIARIYAPATLLVVLAAAFHVPDVLGLPRVPPRGMAAHALGEAVVAWRYVGLLVVPRGLSLVHDVSWPGSLLDPRSLLALAAMAGALAAALRARKKHPLLALGAVWFAGALLPTALVPVRDGMTEPRLYLAAGGLLLAATGACETLFATRRSARLVVTGVVLLLGGTTFQRNRSWLEPMTLWEQAVERAPGAWQAHLGYAEELRDVRQCQHAEVEYREVLRLYPDNERARAGLDDCR